MLMVFLSARRVRRPLLRAAGRGLPGGNSLFFCFAKSKVSKRKGDPGVCVPSLRYGQPAVLGPAGVKNNSPAAQTSFCPDPSGPPLLGAYTRGGDKEYRTANTNECLKEQGHAVACPCSLFILIWFLCLWSPLPIAPSWLGRGAQRQADQGKTVFERSELFLTPLGSSTAGCPVAKRRGPRLRVAFSFAYFAFGE